MAGRPRGAWADKPWRDAVRAAVHEQDEASGEKNLRLLARQLVKEGISGDVSALREVGDRLDGKPAQDLSVNTTVTHEISDLTDAQLAAILTRGSKGRGGKTNDKAGLH